MQRLLAKIEDKKRVAAQLAKEKEKEEEKRKEREERKREKENIKRARQEAKTKAEESEKRLKRQKKKEKLKGGKKVYDPESTGDFTILGDASLGSKNSEVRVFFFFLITEKTVLVCLFFQPICISIKMVFCR